MQNLKLIDGSQIVNPTIIVVSIIVSFQFIGRIYYFFAPEDNQQALEY